VDSPLLNTDPPVPDPDHCRTKPRPEAILRHLLVSKDGDAIHDWTYVTGAAFREAKSSQLAEPKRSAFPLPKLVQIAVESRLQSVAS
jgi:hypothetical protein